MHPGFVAHITHLLGRQPVEGTLLRLPHREIPPALVVGHVVEVPAGRDARVVCDPRDLSPQKVHLLAREGSLGRHVCVQVPREGALDEDSSLDVLGLRVGEARPVVAQRVADVVDKVVCRRQKVCKVVSDGIPRYNRRRLLPLRQRRKGLASLHHDFGDDIVLLEAKHLAPVADPHNLLSLMSTHVLVHQHLERKIHPNARRLTKPNTRPLQQLEIAQHIAEIPLHLGRQDVLGHRALLRGGGVGRRRYSLLHQLDPLLEACDALGILLRRSRGRRGGNGLDHVSRHHGLLLDEA
mmetsp:Transcript_5883/g.11391  ORF Transcript_5883/g.11391 Transcript_5883/m.11391 type:complete len:295 (-) Transcript_5883:169-1053(-)